MRKITSAFGITKVIVNDFLAFPAALYDRGKCPQDMKTEKQILEGTHVLSKDIQVMPFVAYVEEDEKMKWQPEL